MARNPSSRVPAVLSVACLMTGHHVFFWRVRKIAKTSSRLSVRPSAWNNSAAIGRIFMKFDMREVLEKLLRNFTVLPCILIH